MANKKKYYEFEYDVYPSADGAIKHIYVPPQDPKTAPIYGIVENHLDTYLPNPQAIVIKDLLQPYTTARIIIDCRNCTDIPDILSNLITKENTCLHYLHSIPTEEALEVGIELNKGTITPDTLYKIVNNKIVPL